MQHLSYKHVSNVSVTAQTVFKDIIYRTNALPMHNLPHKRASNAHLPHKRASNAQFTA